jgi:hypothetical protein
MAVRFFAMPYEKNFKSQAHDLVMGIPSMGGVNG